VQICSVQTLGRRGFPAVDFVVVDEVHIRYKAVEDWIKQEPTKIFVGLSATPWSRGLADIFDDLIVPTSTSELIEQGYLSPFKAFCAAHPDLSGIRTVAGDYHEGQLAARMSQTKLVGDVIQNWLDKANGAPTLVFAVNRAHAALLHDQFEQAGVMSAYVDANTPREERGILGRRLNEGGLNVICSVGTMTTGIDLDIRCIALARPTKSEMLFCQMVGRGLRTAPGKEHCMIFDHSDNHLRLGMVTEIHHEALKGEKEKEAKSERPTPLPKECPKCSHVIPVGVSECPNCGFKRQRICSVTAEEGELIEIELARKLKRRTNGELSWGEKIRFMGELKGFAAEHGYKDGWAAYKYQERLGVWPNDGRVKYAKTQICGPATRSWIRLQQIRRAQAKSQPSQMEAA
jgi:DNA repair protein RadD